MKRRARERATWAPRRASGRIVKTVRDLLRRMGFVGALLLTLVFAAPAFESHACADEAPAIAAQLVVDTAPVDDLQCPDCGPACANGCCHAQHAATASELTAPSSPVFVARAEVWLHEAAPPLARPAGPDRPPRL